MPFCCSITDPYTIPFLSVLFMAGGDQCWSPFGAEQGSSGSLGLVPPAVWPCLFPQADVGDWEPLPLVGIQGQVRPSFVQVLWLRFNLYFFFSLLSLFHCSVFCFPWQHWALVLPAYKQDCAVQMQRFSSRWIILLQHFPCYSGCEWMLNSNNFTTDMARFLYSHVTAVIHVTGYII